MNFLYPQFLYGLFALAIPIIVHLFNFRKTKKVYFSNTRFLRKVKEASSSKRKLKHYLILLSRLLFVLFLVLAFAQPVLKSDDTVAAQNRVFVYFDNSLSMSNEVDEGISAMDAGLSYLNELLELLPNSTEYRLLTNDFEATSTVYKSKLELVDMSTEMQFSGTKRSVGDIANRYGNKNDADAIYWISDFQQSTAGTEEVEIDSNTLVNVLPLQFSSTKNVAIDSIYLDNPFLIGNEKLKLNVEIRNFGPVEVRDLITKVFVDDVQVATGTVDLGPNGEETVSYDLAFDLRGINKCRVSFEEFPVTFDNEFYFTINASERINVLEIKGTDKPTSITKVYGNEKLFNTSSVNFSNLDYNLIRQSDLVVINGLSQIDPSLAVVINEYLANYGNVVVVPSSTPEIASYRQLMGLQNVTLADTVIQSELATPDFDNPFFENVFEEENTTFAMPSASQLLGWGTDRTATLRFKNGQPFLSRFSRQGNIYVLASPLKDELATFQNHALFVPVMYRIAVESASTDRKLYYFLDEQTIKFKNDTLLADQVFKLKNDTQEVIPAQRVTGNTVYLELPRFELSSGFYDLMLGDKTVSTFAFNNAFDESDMDQLAQEDIANRFGGTATLFTAEDRDSFSKEIENNYIGRPLWQLAIILALIFLLIEVLLIRFFP